MLAALHPGLDLVGVTTVNGNVPIDLTTENTLRVLDHIGRDVPVYRGMAAPLVRPDFPVPRGTPLPGRATVHGDYRGGRAPNAEVAFGADAGAFVRMLLDTFARTA